MDGDPFHRAMAETWPRDHRDHRDQPVLRLPLMEKRHSTRRIVTNHVES